MIKLILNPAKEGKTYTFDKKTVIIGDQSSAEADLTLPGESLQAIHVKILEDHDRHVIVNTANDPFTALNGLPFGKKELRNDDLIQIGDQTLQCIFEQTPQGNIPAQDQHSTPGNDLDAFDIEALVREVEQLDIQPTKPEPSPTPTITTEAPPPPEPTPAKESYYLQEFDDETENWNPEMDSDSPPPPKERYYDSWRMLASFLLAVISITAVFGVGLYFRASGITSQEEKKIAAGIADIAMAMTYAQLNHITPNKQNWADPAFLHNNLEQVLSPSLHTQAQVDNQGQFTKYPYLLRVYTSVDMSRFLIIAQPAPNFLQWLIHKKSIVIDSSSMEMRKMTDIRRLNRLLAAPDPLEGNNGTTVSNVVKDGTLLPLESLAGNRNVWGFSPPSILSSLRPGAENYIYNGPRYYPFGEALLAEASRLGRDGGSSEDLAEIKEKIVKMAAFPNIVLYSSEGPQTALEGKKALTTLAPDIDFLIAYLTFQPDGQVIGSHILGNKDDGDISMLDPSAFQHHSPEDRLEVYDRASSLVNTGHPLFLHLQATAAQRTRMLTPLSDQITSLLTQHNHEIVLNAEEALLDLFQQYRETDQHERERVEEDLAMLYDEHITMPLEDFLQFVEAAQLTAFIHEALESPQGEISDITPLREEDIQRQFARIRESETLEALDGAVQETAETLSLGQKTTDTETLIHYQNAMHNTVLETLANFLLSPHSPYAEGQFASDDHMRVTTILNASWVSEPHEYDYFMGEFSRLEGTAQR